MTREWLDFPHKPFTVVLEMVLICMAVSSMYVVRGTAHVWGAILVHGCKNGSGSSWGALAFVSTDGCPLSTAHGWHCSHCAEQAHLVSRVSSLLFCRHLSNSATPSKHAVTCLWTTLLSLCFPLKFTFLVLCADLFALCRHPLQLSFLLSVKLPDLPVTV